MDKLGRVVAISLGGVLGVNARYWLGVWIAQRVGPNFPWSTFVINVSGSFVIGLLATLFGRWAPHPYLGLFVVVGFLGGYTTFSSYEMEGYWLFDRNMPARALMYIFGSVLAGFIAVSLGVLSAKGIASIKPSLARPRPANQQGSLNPSSKQSPDHRI